MAGGNGRPGSEVEVRPEDVESGEVVVGSSWVRVGFASAFRNPVVVTGSPGCIDVAPCAVHIRNVTGTGFEVKITGWTGQASGYAAEKVNYLVVEKGRRRLPDGSIVEAGTLAAGAEYEQALFMDRFMRIPVVLTSLVTADEAGTAAGRLQYVDQRGFAYGLGGQDNGSGRAREKINYVAWEPGEGKIGSVRYEAAVPTQFVDQAWREIVFVGSFGQTPLLLAGLQTSNGTCNATLRIRDLKAEGFLVKAKEDSCLDNERTVLDESVGYLAMSQLSE